jgi:glycerol-3-phosphate acyltransferase PlsY
VFSFVLAGLLGYILGSLPTAFLLVRWKSRLDVRTAGSGNVGTLNSYQVTGSILVGGAVLAVDAAKGLAAVLLSGLLTDHDFARQACAGASAILGHNFPVWLRFRGGRGLATAAGVVSVFAWPLILVWGVLWSLAYAILREVNPANAAASFVLPLLLVSAPVWLIARVTVAGIPPGEFTSFVALSMIIVLVKHWEPVRAYTGRKRESDSRAQETGRGTHNE